MTNLDADKRWSQRQKKKGKEKEKFNHREKSEKIDNLKFMLDFLLRIYTIYGNNLIINCDM